MATLTEAEREIRIDHMEMLGAWLKEHERTQRWAATQLGIYHGYLSNLITGKQVASEEICRAAGSLMGPLDMDTGKPAGSAWTDVERRDERDRRRRKKIERAEKKKVKKIVPQIDAHLIPLKKRFRSRPHRALMAEEIQATADIVSTLIRIHPEMTPDDLVDVTRATATGFAG